MTSKPSKPSLLGSLIVAPFKLLWTLAVVAIPLLGFWVASSIAAYLNGPVWAVALAGLLLFPILPLLWEWRGLRKARRKAEAAEAAGKTPPKRWLTFFDRMVLRTLVLNLLFIGALLASFPQVGFAALATRGDWMLADRSDPWVPQTRETLFAAAGGLEWLYNAAQEANPYADTVDNDDAQKIDPTPNEFAADDDTTTAPPDPTDPTPNTGSDAKPAKPAKTTSSVWPQEATLHPAAKAVRDADPKDYKAAAKALVKDIDDPFERVKALHDFVADRVAYDVPSYLAGDYPPQDAETVFRERKSVCAGYANLFKAMAESVGEEVVVVVGQGRSRNGGMTGEGHAWNAAKLKGKWYLIDVTWNAGYVNGDTFTREYETSYLFAPPEIFGLNHLPDDPKWQLRAEPISRGEYLRQPILRPSFYAEGLELVDPYRAQISAEDRVQVTLRSTKGRFVMAQLESESGVKKRCTASQGETVHVTCTIPAAGKYELNLFSSPKQYNHPYGYVGQINVNAR